jgi:hypothetical protein
VSVRIAILVEGATEIAFVPALRDFLSSRLTQMPKLDILPCNERIPTNEKLNRLVSNLLSAPSPADAVIALTDVYTGQHDFHGAEDAKSKMREWVGDEPRFHPHVAAHDFEAWLLPFWDDIKKLAGSNRAPPGATPESINHDKPPAYILAEIFRTGTKGKKYIKTRDAARILRGKDISISAQACPELRAFLNTILKLSGGHTL